MMDHRVAHSRLGKEFPVRSVVVEALVITRIFVCRFVCFNQLFARAMPDHGVVFVRRVGKVSDDRTVIIDVARFFLPVPAPFWGGSASSVVDTSFQCYSFFLSDNTVVVVCALARFRSTFMWFQR